MSKVVSHKKPTRALGLVYGLSANPKISVTFDVETFALIRKAAEINSMSFAAAVRVLVASGIRATRAKAGAA